MSRVAHLHVELRDLQQRVGLFRNAYKYIAEDVVRRGTVTKGAVKRGGAACELARTPPCRLEQVARLAAQHGQLCAHRGERVQRRHELRSGLGVQARECCPPLGHAGLVCQALGAAWLQALQRGKPHCNC
jgi:hypothetical protein